MGGEGYSVEGKGGREGVGCGGKGGDTHTDGASEEREVAALEL